MHTHSNLFFLKILKEDYPCSFCTYRANKKPNLKRHLNTKHSSQIAAPILLSNDPIIKNVNNRFQCSTCRSYLVNINEYIKHMNEKHGIQVYIVDMSGEVSIQDQLNSKGRAEV